MNTDEVGAVGEEMVAIPDWPHPMASGGDYDSNDIFMMRLQFDFKLSTRVLAAIAST